jgi:glycerol-3-phosphate O-acyltransferase
MPRNAIGESGCPSIDSLSPFRHNRRAAMDEHVELNRSTYRGIIEEMIRNSQGAPVVTDKNVFQEGKPANKPLMRRIIGDLLLPGSRVDGLDHLLELHALARRKKFCLVLMEHYSNFDLPNFVELLEREGDRGREIADALVAVAGVKLNEESRLVLAFTEIFTRVVIFPSRSVQGIENLGERQEAERRRARINIAALKALMKLRNQGRLVLVFPTGTRTRPWDPNTARGLKQIDTYIKYYSHMVLVAINGNTLLCNPNGKMDEDYPVKDVVRYTVSPVIRCSEFRREALRSRPDDDEDAKQAVADHVMAALADLHARAERDRAG